jgi:hypothetical protein
MLTEYQKRARELFSFLSPEFYGDGRYAFVEHCKIFMDNPRPVKVYLGNREDWALNLLHRFPRRKCCGKCVVHHELIDLDDLNKKYE